MGINHRCTYDLDAHVGVVAVAVVRGVDGRTAEDLLA